MLLKNFDEGVAIYWLLLNCLKSFIVYIFSGLINITEAEIEVFIKEKVTDPIEIPEFKPWGEPEIEKVDL